MSDKDIRQEENIKNCPFCGSSVIVERVPLKHYKGCVIFEIKCLNCGCERSLIKNDSIYRTEEEARANAIAQWNERPSTAGVPQEMSAVKYLKERSRMESWGAENCNRASSDCDDWCCECLYDQAPSCSDEANRPLEAIATVEKWAREHPEENDE